MEHLYYLYRDFLKLHACLQKGKYLKKIQDFHQFISLFLTNTITSQEWMGRSYNFSFFWKNNLKNGINTTHGMMQIYTTFYWYY